MPSVSEPDPILIAADGSHAMAVDEPSGEASLIGLEQQQERLKLDPFAEPKQKDAEIRLLFERIGEEFRDEGEFWLYERNVCVELYLGLGWWLNDDGPKRRMGDVSLNAPTYTLS